MHRAIVWLIPCLAAAATFSETPGEIRAITRNYLLAVRKSPYALSIKVGQREILGHAGGPGPRLLAGSSPRALGAVSRWEGRGDTLFLALGPDVSVTMALRSEWVELSWRVPEGARLEENFPLKTGGHWFGGNVTSGHQWPLETGETALDPFRATSNQTTPVWLASSGAGVFVPTYDRMGYSINRARDGLLAFNVEGPSPEYRLMAAPDIARAHRAFVSMAGKPEAVPPKEYFAEPVFNTWIEYMTRVSQADLVAYARKIRESGFPCRILMLDDGWLERYGDNRFHKGKFPEPAKMVEEIHRLGFRFVLWQIPFVEKDSVNFEPLRARGWLVMDASGKSPAIVRWWNGMAAMVDLSNPAAYRWYLSELQVLARDYGVDGYKLDAGDAEYFRPDFVTFGGVTPNRYTDLWAGLGRYFDINELRVSWLAQPWGLVERLRDKSSDWNVRTGLGSIVRHGLTETMIGYPYFCPDIIGGGLDSSFHEKGYRMDEELFLRWTEASALMPMMQFSYAPWHLSPASEAVVKRYALLHRDLGDYIYSLALAAKQNGTPIVKPLFFRNPEDESAYSAEDEFLLGDRFLVAPVLRKGALSRDVYLPAGTWKDFWNGRIYRGGQTVKNYPAPLDVLPAFVDVR
jgi:alpha-glucosidase (family GH31 glycosyl hydrolase)